MSDTVHVYCDESCHLLNDHQRAMVLGAVWCDADHRAELGRKIKALKKSFGLTPEFEIKWTKVSPGRLDFYLALVDLFFAEPLLHFRAVVVPDKEMLDHDRFNQTHDDFYYKMWYYLLTYVVDYDHQFRVFIDIKDTRGQKKLEKLHRVLCNSFYDFDQRIISDMQLVHSHHIPLLQLADLMIGALSHLHRGLRDNAAKLAVIEHIRQHTGHDLLRSTLPRESKFNVFVWRPQVHP